MIFTKKSKAKRIVAISPKDEMPLDEQNLKKKIKQTNEKSTNSGGIFVGISGRGGRRKLAV